ncbi:CAP domain-containing protein [Nonomuraea sp. NPDC047897]|uniref:CAP domain-containing protein n=1 Tax=Nonomuraea sp. NPDC047897 TaxID=3364346 RepID=UPI003721DA8F
MRRRLQVLACLGGLTAAGLVSTPAWVPAALEAPADEATTGAAAKGAPVPARTSATGPTDVRAGAAGASDAREDAPASTRRPCRVAAAQPVIDKGTIRAAASRAGCDDRTRLRVRLTKVLPGADRTLKSGSRLVTNGRVVAGVRCIRTPAHYYVTAIDVDGAVTAKSRPVKLFCEPPATPKSTATRSTPTPATASTGASSVEDAVVKLTNQARASKGCRPLVHDPKLHTAAERHSADMAARGFFDHSSPDGRDPGDRVKASGFAPISTWGENIAMGQRTAAQVVQGWLDSPGHRANIMNCAFTHIGVGHVTKGPYWTQVFAAH